MRSEKRLSLLIFVLIVLISCNRHTPSSQTQTAAVDDWYTLYFTHPGEAGTGLAIESALDDSIDSANDNIDLAIYSFSLPTIADALIAAHIRGVDVSMVMEADNMDSYQVKRLLAAGIPIQPDNSDGLMHDKFVVIDNHEVWVGSMNLTITSAQEDANNLIRFESKELVADYMVEFDAMYDHQLFSQSHIPKTPYPLFTIGSTKLEAFFPPNDSAAFRLSELIASSDESIVFMASNFTSNTLSAALIAASGRGVDVDGLMDADNAISDTGSDYRWLTDAGIPVILDKDPGRMHHKVMIIDKSIVAFGSYNFTASAEKYNDENLLIIHDTGLAARFLAEYQRLIN
ncbi:MAG: phospholipase D-like domain-containing protein [Anaerolineaceae bacterium]